MNEEDEFYGIEQFEDGSEASENLIIQRFYAKQADEAIEDSKQYDDEITLSDIIDV